MVGSVVIEQDSGVSFMGTVFTNKDSRINECSMSNFWSFESDLKKIQSLNISKLIIAGGLWESYCSTHF